MYKGFYKVFLWTMVIALLFTVFSFSVSEGEEWTCPNCGRGGLMKNFCPSCGTARPEDPGIPFEFKIGDIVAFSSQENADDASDRFIWTVADIDGKVVTLVCISVLPETVVSLMDSETPEDAADFVKYVLIRKVLSEKEIAVIGETGDFEVSDCAAFSDLLIEKKDKYLVLRIESNKVAPFLILVEYAEKSMDEADAAATESPTVTPTLKLATATPKAQPMATATATAKPATATPTVQPTVTATPVVTPTPTATQPAAYGHRHSDLDELKPWTNAGVYGHARRCNVCWELVGFATHTFPDEWTLEFAPSCKYQGREKKVCTVCGGEIYNWLEPTGVHKLGPMVAVINNGVAGHGQKCSVCLEYINFAAHTYPDEWTLEFAPSCTSQGREKKVCTVCGGEFYNWLAPTGHHYVDGFCSACGKKEP